MTAFSQCGTIAVCLKRSRRWHVFTIAALSSLPLAFSQPGTIAACRSVVSPLACISHLGLILSSILAFSRFG
eukprot:CAMPEP_0203891236 /NCGR_PEP_ID=MMETSP0359-20131031/34558_1 /ASSEMBLY_ACC=CAM_ASM_000338 /TAXON_ID=268821 /ORGANISM="Scrippsiella Hangoei, Strain SHTV-5" /LENGTH=71 /DNA_ID=CAMNT_0050812985 /DNA_START=101 /DNA_END=313 /DNA_ORIENTATION=-